MSKEWRDKWGASTLLITTAYIILIMVFLPDPLVNYTWILPGSDWGLEDVYKIEIPNLVRQFTYDFGLATVALTSAAICFLFWLGLKTLPEDNGDDEYEYE